MQPDRPVLKIVMTLQTVLADNVPVTRTIKLFTSSFSERHVANVNVGRVLRKAFGLESLHPLLTHVRTKKRPA